MRRSPSIALAIVCISLAPSVLEARAEEIVFHSVMDGSPLDLTPKPGEKETAAVRKFKRTGRNPYNQQERALREGRRLYAARCQGCHLSNGKGRMPGAVDALLQANPKGGQRDTLLEGFQLTTSFYKSPEGSSTRPFRVSDKVMSDSIDTLVEWGGLEPAAKEKVKTFYTNDYLPK